MDDDAKKMLFFAGAALVVVLLLWLVLAMLANPTVMVITGAVGGLAAVAKWVSNKVALLVVAFGAGEVIACVLMLGLLAALKALFLYLFLPFVVVALASSMLGIARE